MDDSSPGFFRNSKPVMNAVAAYVLACAGSSAFAETGARMIAIDRMMPGSPPAGFTFATTGRGGGGERNVVAAASERLTC